MNGYKREGAREREREAKNSYFKKDNMKNGKKTEKNS